MSEPHTTLPRRGLLAAVGLAGAAAVVRPGPAEAAPTTDRTTGPAPVAKTRDGVPAGTTTLASAPLSGYSYTYLTMWDFTPENFGQGRAWTASGGVYTPTGDGALWATAQLPPGAVLGDVEWYLSASQDTQLLGRIWLAGSAVLYLQAVDGTIAAGTAGVVRETAVSSGRSIKVSAGGPSGSRTHYLVDLVGYLT